MLLTEAQVRGSYAISDLCLCQQSSSMKHMIMVFNKQTWINTNLQQSGLHYTKYQTGTACINTDVICILEKQSHH